MSGYRPVYQCKECNKVYTVYYKCFAGGIELCRKCGSIGKIETIIAKPKLFGLRGWEVKEEGRQEKVARVTRL